MKSALAFVAVIIFIAVGDYFSNQNFIELKGMLRREQLEDYHFNLRVEPTKDQKIFAVNHLFKREELDYSLKVGDQINQEKIDEVFNKDISNTIINTFDFFTESKFLSLPKTIQQAVLNMVFDEGITEFAKHKRIIGNILLKKWQKVAEKIEETDWYRDTDKKRTNKILQNIRKILNEFNIHFLKL